MHRLHQPELARHYFLAGFGIVSARETDPQIKDVIDRAIANPTPQNLCAAQTACHGTDWYEQVLFALAAIGISAAGLVLGEHA